MADFLLYALLGGVGVALVAGPLGSFVVWRRMAYFGDTLSHSALLGIAFGILMDINLSVAVILGCVLLASVLIVLQHNRQLAVDTLLGILAHSTLALGLVVVSLLDNVRLDLMAYLFGDLLSISLADIAMIYIGGLLVLACLYFLWHPLLAITIHEDLARVEGLPVNQARAGFMLIMALVIAMAMKIVGVLLITALLIIPAATARRITNTPEQMALGASIIGAIAVMLGIGLSYWWDTPTGPSVVLSASFLFALAYSFPKSSSYQ